MPLFQGHLVLGQIFVTKGRVLLILREQCWESLYAVCKVLVILIRKCALVKNACTPRLNIVITS